ncbi:MAG: 2Fe-2S iron-sulfur cluster-binding protein, partial [Candidatus Thermoplasmatota archaeon]|nr:2Fe-2S iron-sulfur cluster-binding protein [Candidatus Thermoplasmatota archaeon]
MKEATNIVVKIDENDYSFETPDTVLNKLLELGYDIPHICYQPNLGPLQSCDSCLVNINGKVVRSCSTQIRDGDSVDVSSASINDLRIEAVQ